MGLFEILLKEVLRCFQNIWGPGQRRALTGISRLSGGVGGERERKLIRSSDERHGWVAGGFVDKQHLVKIRSSTLTAL